MELEKQTQSNSIKFIPLLVCPDCRKDIPSFHLRPSNGKMLISLRCMSCPIKDKVASLHEFMQSLKENPIEDSQNLKEVKPICRKHNALFSHYCKQCQVNFCINCARSHSSHIQIQLNSFNHSAKEPQPEFFNEVKAKNRELARAFIAGKDKKLNRSTELKEEIQSAWSSIDLINEDLELLYKSQCKTEKAFHSFPLYQLMNQQGLILNTNKLIKYNEDMKTLEEKHEALKRYLERNYVFKQDGTNQWNAIMKAHVMDVSSIIELSDGSLLATSEDSLRIWDPTTNECIFKKEPGWPYDSFVQLSDGKLAGLRLKCIDLLDRQTFSKIAEFPKNKVKDCYIYCLIELFDGRLAFGYSDACQLWNISTKECTATLKANKSINCLVQLLNETLAGATENQIMIWDLTTNECIATLQSFHPSLRTRLDNEDNWAEIRSLVQLFDGRLCSCSSNTIDIWNISTKESIAFLNGHTGCIIVVIQLKDGRLASSATDGTIKIWSMKTFQCVDTLKGINNDNEMVLLIQLIDGRLVSTNGIVRWPERRFPIMIWDTSVNEH